MYSFIKNNKLFLTAVFGAILSHILSYEIYYNILDYIFALCCTIVVGIIPNLEYFSKSKIAAISSLAFLFALLEMSCARIVKLELISDLLKDSHFPYISYIIRFGISSLLVILVFIFAKREIKTQKSNHMLQIASIILVIPATIYLFKLGIIALVVLLIPYIFFFPKLIKASSHEKRRRYVALIFAIALILSPIISRIGGHSSPNNGSCNHESCKENGPFPCYGKNNTCRNTTSCYKDLYCDDCD